MKSIKNKLTDKQFQINRRIELDSQLTSKWIAQQGVSNKTFNSADITFLQAKKQAHQLLKFHKNNLSKSQLKTLQHFNLNQAHTVLNISSKINRQLFKQHRQLTQA